MFLIISSWYFLLPEPVRLGGLPNTTRSRTKDKKSRSSCFAPTLSILHIEHEWTCTFVTPVSLTSLPSDKLLKSISLRLEILTVSCALQYFLETNLRCQAVFVNFNWPFPWESGAAGSLLSKETVTLHYKPTDSHNYLLHSSSHPQYVKDVIPFSQILRLWRLRL